MKLLSLDLSTKTGFAVFHDGNLVDSGTLWPDKTLKDYSEYPYPFDYMMLCSRVAGKIYEKFLGEAPNVIVVEETTASNDNLSQKKLEYIHCLFLSTLVAVGSNVPVFYVRDGVWKRVTGGLQNADERRWNAKVRTLKKKVGKGKRVKLAGIDLSRYPRHKVDKHFAYAFDTQDYYIRAANEIFSKKLTEDDDNEAAAMLIGLAFLKGAPTCDGTRYGGLLPEENGEDPKPNVV